MASAAGISCEAIYKATGQWEPDAVDRASCQNLTLDTDSDKGHSRPNSSRSPISA